MDAYSIAKMETTEIISAYGSTLEENAKKLAEKNKIEEQKMTRKQTIYSLSSFGLVLLSGILMFLVIDGQFSVSKDMEVNLFFGFGSLAIIGIFLFFPASSYKRKAAALRRTPLPEQLITKLAESVREEALNTILASNWLCPYCSAANPNDNKVVCTCCKNPYDERLAKKHGDTARRIGKIPPAVTR